MRWYTGLVLRLAVHAGATILGVAILFLGAAGILVALGGTGGFTADPPPQHPRIGAALIVIPVCVVFASALFFFWRALVRMIDRAEAR